MRHPLSSVHETFYKLVHYQSWETCIGAGRLILNLKTCETYRSCSQETNHLKAKIITKLTLTRANETKSVKGFKSRMMGKEC